MTESIHTKSAKICQVEGCNNKVRSRGCCGKHYKQLRKRSDFTPITPKVGCDVPGCCREHNALGYCGPHYDQIRRFGEIRPPKKRYPCKVDGCDTLATARGYCNKHYQQILYNGRILKKTTHDPNEIVTKGDISFIRIYNVAKKHIKVAIIDTEDVKLCEKYKWHMGTAYISTGKNRHIEFIHNIILNRTPNPDDEVDHINRNRLDNRKANLRICNRCQNMQNVAATYGASGAKGVVLNKNTGRWGAKICCNKVKYYLGAYDKKEDAIITYNNAALKYHGDFAYLNEVPDGMV